MPKFECTYLVSKKAEKQSGFRKLAKLPAYQTYGANSDIFYFPIHLKRDTKKNENKNSLGRTLVIDPWPAYAVSKMRSTDQIFVTSDKHIFRQDRHESKLPPPLRPQFLVEIEKKLNTDLKKYNATDDPADPVRLQVYREAFEIFISGCTHYAPFLSQVKSQYDQYILHQSKQIKRIYPMEENVHSLMIEYERRLGEAKASENADVKVLRDECQHKQKKIEKLEQDRVQLKTLIDGLTNELSQDTHLLRAETDGRKLAQLKVNELSNILSDMENILRNQQAEIGEDPVKLRVAYEMAKETLAKQTRKLVEYEANFNSTVSLDEHEKVVKELEQERELTTKLRDEIEGYANRYELLQDHCAALDTYKDLYMLQCGYALRVLAAKGEQDEKLEYIGILLSRWRKLINEKPIGELTRMAAEEMARFEQGGLPVLQRSQRKERTNREQTGHGLKSVFFKQI